MGPKRVGSRRPSADGLEAMALECENQLPTRPPLATSNRPSDPTNWIRQSQFRSVARSWPGDEARSVIPAKVADLAALTSCSSDPKATDPHVLPRRSFAGRPAARQGVGTLNVTSSITKSVIPDMRTDQISGPYTRITSI